MNREFQRLELKERLYEKVKRLELEESDYLSEHTKQLTSFDVTVALLCVIAGISLVYFAG